MVKDGTVHLTHEGFSPEDYDEVRDTLEEIDKAAS
jgi:hypothetical protein